MIDLATAIDLVERTAAPLPPRRQRLLEALGRRLAEAIDGLPRLSGSFTKKTGPAKKPAPASERTKATYASRMRSFARWLVKAQRTPRPMVDESIRIVNAHEHNLKNLSVDIPRGKFNALVSAVADEQTVAAASLTTATLRVVLHLEQPRTHSKFFPRVFDPRDVERKLRRIVRPIDPHARVAETGAMHNLPWSVT